MAVYLLQHAVSYGPRARYMPHATFALEATGVHNGSPDLWCCAVASGASATWQLASFRKSVEYTLEGVRVFCAKRLLSVLV
jgi:hypothetical protein